VLRAGLGLTNAAKMGDSQLATAQQGYSGESRVVDGLRDVVSLEDLVHNGDVLSWDVVNCDVADGCSVG
jgi:hypothetical protein